MRGNRWVGRWREDVVSESGLIQRLNRKRILGTKEEFKTKREVQRALDVILAPINSLEYRPTFQITFGEFAERWKSKVLPQAYQPSYQHEVGKQLAGKLIPVFGSTSLKDINTELIQSYVGYLTADGGLGAKSVRNLIATMSGMWRQALDWHYISHDPFKGLVLPKIERVKSRVYTLEEILKIIGAANEPLKTFLLIAAETGMRPGEVCGLESSHVDLQNRVIRVEQKAWRGRLMKPKTETAYRNFTISPQLVQHLRNRSKDSGLLFTTRNGKPWQVDHVRQKKLEPLLNRLGIERKGLHAFRHFNATMLDRLNAPVKLRQERLGHSDPRVTLGMRNKGGYTHIVSEDDARISEQLGSVLCPNASIESKAPSSATC